MTMSDLSVRTWGEGTPVVLVHGSLATGSDEWPAQQPLVEQDFQLLALDRRGYGQSPAADGEDFLRDAEDIAEIVGDGCHLVGHSYGGLGAMFTAARRPDATLSLALLEPPAFSLAQQHPAAEELVAGIRNIWEQDLPDREWVVRFLQAVGTDPDALPPGFLDDVIGLVPVLRRGRPPWEADLPLAELAASTFPKVVVTGGHNAGFEAICDELAERIGAARVVVEGAGHEVQFTGQPINEALLDLWQQAA